MEHNPYQPPEAELAVVGSNDPSGAIAIRKQHIGREASVRSIGLLYYIGAFLVGAGVLLQFSPLISYADHWAIAGFLIGMLLILGLNLWVGAGLRALRRRARVAAGILSGIGLLAFPIGTIINLYILYLLFSPKGKMVFSDDYREIIEATPQIRYRTSTLTWILLILFVLLLVLAVVYRP